MNWDQGGHWESTIAEKQCAGKKVKKDNFNQTVCNYVFLIVESKK